MELCIDFGGTEIKLAVTDGDRVVATGSIPVLGSPADLTAAAVEARRLLAETTAGATSGATSSTTATSGATATATAGTTPGATATASTTSDTTAGATAVGIAVPGVVDPRTGRMLHANAKYDFLEDFDLNAWALAEFGVPAVVENDARAALIGETSTGSAAGERDAVLVTLGTGIGTAALIDGTPLRGRTGHAGILGGHLTVDLDGSVCPCGNIGCGEALASTWALPDAVTMTEVFTTDAHPELRERFLHVWGAVVTSLVHSYDPAVVILSGGILRAGDAVRTPIEAHVRAHLWPSMTPPRFVVPPEPELSVARGLSVLARATTTDTPTPQEEQ